VIAVEITSIKIDDYKVLVPVGLSELLSNSWTRKRKESVVLKEYTRQVIEREGALITRLCKKR
jgi:hypothetical protein